MKKKILIAISGASGASLALRAFELLPKKYEKYLIVSKNAKIVLEKENHIFYNNDISAPVASGSFGVSKMLIIPTSINTLSKIACGIADNLITRSAAVMIKEQKKLLLAPREIPYSAIVLENMLKLSKLNNVFIAPPNLGYYANIKSLEDMERFIIGRWFDLMGIKNNLYKRWKSESNLSRDI